jgi:phosphatidylinositol-3-phosphatase
VRVPRRISPAARARRALLADVLAGLALTLVVVLVSAGVGIVGFAGLLVALLLVAWIAIEKCGLTLYRRWGPRGPLLALAVLVLAAVAVAAGGCGTGGSANAASAAESAPPTRAKVPAAVPGSHAFLIVLENHEYGEALGPEGAPYLKRLAREGAVPSNYFARRHPSLPNYLALLGGSTFGIEEDCTSCRASGPNLATQLQAAGVSWRAYLGGMPRPCFRGAEVGLYAKRHNPFMYFPSISTNPALCRNDVPETALESDLANESLPEFAWISPNLCDDAHNCDLGSSDRYLASLVPKLRRHLGPGGLLVITFDEGTSEEGCCGASGGRIATILVGPQVRRGAKVPGNYTEYALLATLEERFGLPRLRAAKSAPTLAAAFGPIDRLRPR